jgi:glyoxylase-like metal-dependent hydrolase (beta-lactamase superfamily II)
LAAVVTHSHPDHYAGLGEIVAGTDVPIYAPQGVIDTIAADDALKDQIIGPMFGEDWPASRLDQASLASAHPAARGRARD